MKTIFLEFNGYWREIDKKYIPEQSGIYCVYTCKYNYEKDIVELHKLLYIGESINVNLRLRNHDKLLDWTKKLHYGEELCYSFASIESKDRE